MENTDLIIGLHSIDAAIRNKSRENFCLYLTEKALENFKSYLKNERSVLDRVEINLLSPHKLQQMAKEKFELAGFNYSRVTSNMFLECSALEIFEGQFLNSLIKKQNLKLFCLDQVTDTHNAAAVLRTASFYGVDGLIISAKGNFGLSPNFYRIASGAVEYVPIIRSSNLSKTISKLQAENVLCIGFSEHSDESLLNKPLGADKICLVLGSEDKGLSHSVMRVLNYKVSFSGQGDIKTLNVSVASAIAMEKFFTA